MAAKRCVRGRLFVGVVIAVVFGVTAAAVGLGESLGANSAVIVPGRQAVTVSGTLNCTTGQTGRMRVTVTEHRHRATGTTPVRCDGRQTSWRTRIRTARGTRLSPGLAGVSVTIEFDATRSGQRAIGEAGQILLRCPASRRRSGTIDQIALRAPDGSSRAHGVAIISRRRGRLQVSVTAEHVRPNTRSDAYAVWLHSAGGDDRLLGFVNPGVGHDGRLQTLGSLPGGVGCYEQIVVSRERSATPNHPGTTVLSGAIKIS